MSLSMVIAMSIGIAMLAIVLAVITPAAELKRVKETGEEPKGFFDAYIKPTLRTFIPQSQLDASLRSAERGKYKELLERSGNPWKLTETELKAFKILGALIGLVLGILAWFMDFMPFPGWILPFLLPVLGYEYPSSVLKGKAKSRLQEYDRALPEFMDLLVINMKAGRNLESAMSQTVDKMPPGALKSELASVMRLVRSGAPLRQTMETFSKKTGSEDIQAFVKAIALSQQSGGDPSETISHQAEIMRDQRVYRLEKKTASLSTYLMMVLLVTMIPALLIIVVGPGMIQLMEFL